MPDESHREPRRVRTPEAAAILGLSPATLRKLRVQGGGPTYCKLGRACVYKTADLEAYAAERERTSTSAQTRRAADARADGEGTS